MELDVEAVNRVGIGFVDTAAALSEAAAKTKGLGFTGARAGREYSAEGEALREGVQRITAALDSWSASAAGFGESVYAATARIVDTDASNADRLGRVQS